MLWSFEQSYCLARNFTICHYEFLKANVSSVENHSAKSVGDSQDITDKNTLTNTCSYF